MQPEFSYKPCHAILMLMDIEIFVFLIGGLRVAPIFEMFQIQGRQLSVNKSSSLLSVYNMYFPLMNP